MATSTPRATDNSETPTEAYRLILPGMTSRLYPTLVADSLLRDAHVRPAGHTSNAVINRS